MKTLWRILGIFLLCFVLFLGYMGYLVSQKPQIWDMEANPNPIGYTEEDFGLIELQANENNDFMRLPDEVFAVPHRAVVDGRLEMIRQDIVYPLVLEEEHIIFIENTIKAPVQTKGNYVGFDWEVNIENEVFLDARVIEICPFKRQNTKINITKDTEVRASFFFCKFKRDIPYGSFRTALENIINFLAY